MHDSVLDAEGGLHRHAHRDVVLNPDRAAVERRLPPIARQLGNDDVHVRRHRAPARAVIVERHRAVLRPHVLHRRHESPGSAPAAHVELRKAVFAAGPLLEDHVPVGHHDRIDQHFAAEHRIPRERDVDAPGRQERAIGRDQTFDDEVLDHELAAEEADSEPADVHRPADALRALALGERAQTRTEIDCERRDNRHGECHRQHGDAHLGEAKREVRSNALEALEPEGHSVTTDLLSY